MEKRQIGQYRVVERLGNGGMGTVYRATDELLDREVALKVIDTEIEESSARMRAEAAALARLNHPGIATVYELLEDEDRLVLVMELVRGRSLQQVLEQTGIFSLAHAAEICMQTLTALAHAHTAGVIHRDLKPANLMVTDTGAVKIMDFGIARVNESVHLTSAGLMMGTPAYMAPEQVLGNTLDARIDLYAMGVVFYRLVTGELPFRGETPFAMAQSQVNDPPTPIQSIRPDLPEWVGEILEQALAKAPEERFQSAMEFHDALAQCVAAAPQSQAVDHGARTEAMVRPEFPPAVRAQGIPKLTAHRRRIEAGIGLTAPILIIGASLWLLTPFGGTKSQAAGVSRPSLLQPPPAPQPQSSLAQSGRVVAPSPGFGAKYVGALAHLASRTVPPPPAIKTASLEASPAPTPLPAGEPLAPVLFSKMKLLAVNGTKTSEVDVVVTFSESQISVQRLAAKSPIAALQYRQIAKATYAFAGDPVWDPLMSSPAGKLDLPGFMGRSRHWLVLQSRDAYAILRLDGPDRNDVLTTFESRTGLTINRVAAPAK